MQSPNRHLQQSTEEFENLRFLLRDDLQFSLQSHHDQLCYVIEDTTNNAYFRIGEKEYKFLSLLDGRNTVRQAIAILASTEQSSLSEDEAQVICRWLSDNQLVSLLQGFNEEELDRSSEAKQVRKLQQFFNPLSVSLVLGNPTALLRSISPATMWLFRPMGVFVCLGIIVLGFVKFIVDYKCILANPSQVIDSSNWIWLGMVWLCCKLVHEASHALCCMYHGRRVHAFGVNLVMFFPLPFVDVSAAWKLPNKWHRIQIAFAGVYAELVVAAIAAILHSCTSDPWLKMLCINTMFSAGLVSLVVNLNPLLRYDGYFILLDYLEFPNLAPTGSQHVKALLKLIFCGVRSKNDQNFGILTRIGLITYGVLSGVWRISVTLTMVLAARWLFHGAGLILATTAAMSWLVWPALRGLKYATLGCDVESPSRLRFLSVTGCMFLAAWIVGANLKWSETLTLSGVVDYVPNSPVRCEVNGFVSMIRVAQGQQVQHGDILLELANDNIIHRCREVELELVESQFRSDNLLSTGDITSHRAEMVEQETLRHRLWEANKLLEKLTVRAPNNGIVIAQDIENLQGQFLNEGDPVCVVGEPNSLAIRLLIPQQVIDAVTELKGQVGRVTFAGNMCHEGEAPLVSIDPRGTLDILHPALAANSGGPIAIQPSVSGRVELVEPHFIGTAALPLCIQDHCASGQLVNFQIAVSRMTILEVVRNLLQYKFK